MLKFGCRDDEMVGFDVVNGFERSIDILCSLHNDFWKLIGRAKDLNRQNFIKQSLKETEAFRNLNNSNIARRSSVRNSTVIDMKFNDFIKLTKLVVQGEIASKSLKKKDKNIS